MRSFGRIVTKGLSSFAEATRAVYYRHVALSWVRFGRKVRFLGSIQCLGVTGTIAIGEKTVLGGGISLAVSEGGAIRVGRDCSINQGTVISALDQVNIGDRVRIGEYCSIRDNDHAITGAERILTSGFRKEAVSIGDDVWIGRNVTIMLGCTIGAGAVIGANSFVNRDVPPMSVVVGSPSRVVRSRA